MPSQVAKCTPLLPAPTYAQEKTEASMNCTVEPDLRNKSPLRSVWNLAFVYISMGKNGQMGTGLPSEPEPKRWKCWFFTLTDV